MQPPLSHQAAVLTRSRERAAEERKRDRGARVLKLRGKERERQMAQMEVRKQTRERQEEAGQRETK